MPITIKPATLKYKNSSGTFQVADCLKGDSGSMNVTTILALRLLLLLKKMVDMFAEPYLPSPSHLARKVYVIFSSRAAVPLLF